MIALALAALVAQPLPPELRQRQTPLDPALPDALREVAERASAAELDPKRGVGNAMEIWKAAKLKLPEREHLIADLRIAATVLRAKFAENKKVEEPIRYQQALSTYSRLDLTEPGLAVWLERALEHTPGARATLAKVRTLRIALLARGSGVDPSAFEGELTRAFDAVGFSLERAKPDAADFILKLGADEVRSDSGRATVRVTLDLAARPHSPGEAAYKESLFRTSEAADHQEALAASIRWLARIGGRQMFFHHLSQNGLPDAVFAPPGGDPHDHGAEAKKAVTTRPKVSLPKRPEGGQ